MLTRISQRLCRFRRVLSYLALLLLLCQPYSSALATSAWGVVFNGAPSSLPVQETESGLVVPVYFPVSDSPDGQQFSVRVRQEFRSKEIHIDSVRVQDGLPRGEGDCPTCDGAKDCQSCYPAGSKVNYAGEPCFECNASGKCSFCSGTGDCYSCDGDGFETGCNTCGKMTAKEG